MLTAEAPADTARKSEPPPAFDGWYDPDSIVFQAVDIDVVRAETALLDPDEGIQDRSVAGVPTPR